MTKKEKKLIVLILMISVNLLLLVFLQYREISKHQVILSNNLYHNWAQELIDDDWDATNFLNEGGRLFFEHTKNGNVRTVLTDGNWQPPLTEGEFFNENFAFPAAVAGERMFEENQDYFIFEGQSFKIVGILGVDFPTFLDYMVLLNDGGKELPVINTIIDMDSPSDFERLTEEISSRPVFSVREQNQFSSQFNFGRDLFEEMMMINTYLVLLLLLIITSHTFFVITKDSDEIFSLLGFTNKRIVTQNHLYFGIVFIVSISVTMLIDFGLGWRMKLYHWEIYVFIFAFQQLMYLLFKTGGSILRGGRGYVN